MITKNTNSMSTGKENRQMDSGDDNLINKNSNANNEQAKKFDDDQSNVDPLKPQFERSNLQANQEKKAGSGGAAMDPGRTEERQNNDNK